LFLRDPEVLTSSGEGVYSNVSFLRGFFGWWWKFELIVLFSASRRRCKNWDLRFLGELKLTDCSLGSLKCGAKACVAAGAPRNYMIARIPESLWYDS